MACESLCRSVEQGIGRSEGFGWGGSLSGDDEERGGDIEEEWTSMGEVDEWMRSRKFGCRYHGKKDVVGWVLEQLDEFVYSEETEEERRVREEVIGKLYDKWVRGSCCPNKGKTNIRN